MKDIFLLQQEIKHLRNLNNVEPDEEMFKRRLWEIISLSVKVQELTNQEKLKNQLYEYSAE